MWCMEIVIIHPINQNRRGERADQMMPRLVALLSSHSEYEEWVRRAGPYGSGTVAIRYTYCFSGET